jgi:hypothetical protein
MHSMASTCPQVGARCYPHFVDNQGYHVSRPSGCRYGVSRDYMTKSTLLHRWKTHSPPQKVTVLQMASTTPIGFRKAMGLAP